MLFRYLLNNLQVKVSLLFLFISLAPLVIGSVFALRSVEALIIRMVSNQIEGVADDKVSLLERWIHERRADLKVMADSSILRSMNGKIIAPYLKLMGLNYEVYRDFRVVSRDRQTVYDSTDLYADYGGEEWFREAMAGRIFQSGILLEAGKSESVFRIASPVYDHHGQVAGAVCATVGTHAILSIILKVSLGMTGESYLVDKQGTFLAHQDPQRILSDNITQSGSFQHVFGESHDRGFYTDYRNIQVLGASRYVPGTEWYLVVEQDRDEAFASLHGLKRYLSLVTVFSALGAFSLAWLFAYYIVKPISQLREAADALEHGDFENALVKTNRGDEIGALHTAFRKMARQLRQRQNHLEEEVVTKKAKLRDAGVRLRMTEEAAARSQRLAELGRLAAGVTHEIRTPLASLKLFLQSVREEIEISPEYEEDYRIAMKQMARIEGSINRFLDFARPQDPVFGAVDIPHLINEALLVVQPRANQQEATIVTRIADGLPELIGDRRLVSEVILNLMVNALDAMSKGDSLTISVSQENRDSGGQEHAWVRIDLADTGQGIEPENIPKLFDPFFTTKASGTGLGLSIVNSAIIRHGGEVKVESAVGKGTTFSIFLPVQVVCREENDEQDLDR